ncbi:MAG: outer membrane beta-barrel protein [Chitinophagales bacterium]
MKQTLAVILLLFLTTTTIFAQRGLEVGLKVLPQTSWIFNDDDFEAGDALDFEPKFKMAYGLNIGINLSDRFGIQSGVIYSPQGQKYTHTNEIFLGTIANTSEVRLNYIQIPVLLKLNSDPMSVFSFVAGAGVQFGFLQDAKYYINNVEINKTLLGDDATEFYNEKDLSVVFNIGTQINVTEHLNLSLAIQADYSLDDIENKKEGVLPSYRNINDRNASSQNLTAGLQVGINYVIGR